MIAQPDIPVEQISRYRSAGWWRADRTHLDDFLDHANERGDRVAVVGHVRGEAAPIDHADTDAVPSTGCITRRTFAELLVMVDRCALTLIDLGVAAGEVVAFQLPNGLQLTTMALACARVGAVPLVLAPMLRTRELRFMLDAVRARVGITIGTFRGVDHVAMWQQLRAEHGALEHVFVVNGAAELPDSSFEAGFLGRAWEVEAAAKLDACRPGPDDIAQVQFTSGTTGRPKGVVHTYNTLYAGCRGMVERLGLTADDVVFALSTMAHQTGFLNGCVMPVANGMTAVHQDRWCPDTMLDLVAGEGVTYASGATPFMIDACEAAERRPRSIPTLRYFRSGGSAVPRSVVDRVRRSLGTQVVVSWGMTENGVCTISGTDDSRLRPEDSDGLPLPWVRLRVTDPDTAAERPHGVDGLLWVKSASQCVGYLNDDDGFAAAHDVDGWFNTGDIGHLRADGSLCITGRLKELIIRGGENIPVVEVEHALLSLDEVAEVVLVGVPDERLGERACAVVVRRGGERHASERDAPERDAPELHLDRLRSHLAGIGMAKQYWPEHLVVVEQLPRTPSGKVRKVELRATAMALLGLGCTDAGGDPGMTDPAVGA